MSVDHDFVTAFVAHLTALARTRGGLRNLRSYVEARGVGAVLSAEDAFSGANRHVSAADFPAALDALDALEAVLVDPATGEPTAHGQALARFIRPADLG